MNINIKEKDFFHQATLRICGSLEIEQALHSCFIYLRQFIPADELLLNFLDLENNSVKIHARADKNGGTVSDLPIPFPPNWLPALLSTKVFPDLTITNGPAPDTLADIYRQTIGTPGSSLLTMRLRVEGELLGSLTVRAQGFNRFRPEHLELLAQLKEPWAIALSNSRRFRELLEIKEMLADDNRYLQEEMRKKAGKEIVGADSGLKEVMNLIRRVAPLSSPVLLLGETGVGKEVLARHLHDISPRREGPFITVNCGAIPGTLLDSELFGHEKGAFTGAVARKRGRFERAHGGTIFLDEAAELTMEAQVRLLRVLQEKEIERVGGSKTINLDIRVMAATHRNLEEMVGLDSFRQDLYYRLKVFPIQIPPLRQRKEDIADLVAYFAKRKSVEMGLFESPALAQGAIQRLMQHHWPGNVRELENAVERAMIVRQGGPLDFSEKLSLPAGVLATGPGKDKPAVTNLDEMTRLHIRSMLHITGGKVEGKDGAAELLGINPSTLRHRMRKLGIPFGREIKHFN